MRGLKIDFFFKFSILLVHKSFRCYSVLKSFMSNIKENYRKYRSEQAVFWIIYNCTINDRIREICKYFELRPYNLMFF